VEKFLPRAGQVAHNPCSPPAEYPASGADMICSCRRLAWAALAACAFLVWIPTSRAQGPDIEDLRPGLIAIHGDGKREVVRLEPGIVLSLGEKEAPHPSLAATEGRTTWAGYVNVTRAGNYKFRARLRGQLKVTVAGKEVFSATSDDKEP